MPYEILWSETADEQLDELFNYLIEHASPWDAENVYAQVLGSTQYLAQFPRLYEAAPQYGEGVRRISVAGQNVLYEVDDQAQIVTVIAAVGDKQ